MTLISIKKTAVVEPAPTGTVSLYVDAADDHLKQVDEAGAIIDLTDGSATSSPNMANEVNIALAALQALSTYPLKTTYRITDASQGVVRVYVKSTTELTATAMLEGTDDGTGSITAGQWGNYDLDGDVFTPSGVTYKELVFTYTSTDDTDNGTAVILQNDFGGSPTVTRGASGVTIALTGAFTVAKTIGNALVCGDDSAGAMVPHGINTDANSVSFFINDSAGAGYAGVLGDPSNASATFCQFSVRVYP